MADLTRFHSIGLSGKMRRMSDRIAVAGKFVITIGQVDSKEPDLPAEKILQLIEIMFSPFCNELSHFNLNWH